MRASRAGLFGAAVGAAAATIVLVSVYEGKVLTASTHGRAEVQAGEKATLAAGKRPQVRDRLAVARGSASGPGRGVARRASAVSVTAASRPSSPVKLAQQNNALRAEVADLRAQLQRATKSARQTKTFNLSKQELLSMAKKCELRWDMPSLGTEPPTARASTVKKLGMSDTERDGINKVMADNFKRTVAVLRRLYVQVTGDKAGADDLSPSAMVYEITQKSPRSELQRAFKQLAYERAGLAAKPADPTQSSAVEQLYRWLTHTGDRVEAAIGKQIGPDLARRYREAGGGFSHRSRSGYGCPK